MLPELALGVDVGGVIIDRKKNDNSDTSLLGPNYLAAADVDLAFTYLALLNRGLFKDRVWIVSKCGENVERKTCEWMVHTKFHEVTGIPKERLVFVRGRADKAPVAERLELTHFVDDRLEVLHHMKGIVPHRILFNPVLEEVSRWFGSVPGIVIHNDWLALSGWLEACFGRSSA